MDIVFSIDWMLSILLCYRSEHKHFFFSHDVKNFVRRTSFYIVSEEGKKNTGNQEDKENGKAKSSETPSSVKEVEPSSSSTKTSPQKLTIGKHKKFKGSQAVKTKNSNKTGNTKNTKTKVKGILKKK